MKWILVLLSLTLCQVHGQIALVEILNEFKSSWIKQVEKQVAQTESSQTTKLNSELGKYAEDIHEAIQFAHDEVNRLSELLVDLSEECTANLPATPQSIRTTGNDFMNKCVNVVLNGVSGEVNDRIFNIMENYRANATDFNVVYNQEFFKKPMDVFSLSLYLELSKVVNNRAVYWDNVENMKLYGLRAELATLLEPIGPALDTCIMDFKEFIATEYGRVFLYLWEC